MVSMLSLGCASPVGAPDPSAEAAQADHVGSSVDFAGCREVANVGNAPTANIRPLVPAEFTLAGDATTTPFVVRTVHCDSVSVDGKQAKESNVVQIGAVILPPDGDGDINNYTLFYDASDSQLAVALAHLGVPAKVVPQLEESLVVNPDGSGQYHFAVPAPFQPPLTFDGPVGAPFATIPFTANWWFSSDQGTVKMASSFPQLDFAGNEVVLTVPEGSVLAEILGTTTVSDWPNLALFDHFPTAHMDVTVR
jgi:hypothetical protein